jgi:tetratricopeptide (TPR) repeat protein
VFFLLTVLAYLRMTEHSGRSRIKWLILTNLAFAAMLLSKTMGLTLPFVLLVLDVYPLRRFSRETAAGLLREKIPLFALMFGALALLLNSAGTAGGMSGREHYPLIQSLARPGVALMFYVAKTLLPIGLSPLYWYRPELGLPQVVGWILLLALSAALFLRRHRFPGALAAWMAYGLLIAPASGLVSMGSFTGADHYTYVACLPFAAVGAAVAVFLLRRWPAATATGVSAAVLLAFAAGTWRYCGVWTNSVSLWSRAVELDPDVYFSRTNLGRALAARGEWDRAIAEYTRSIELFPGWFETFGHRARARLNRGDAPGAIEDAGVAIRLEPGWAEAFNTRGIGFSKVGRPREAIADFSAALKIRPQFTEARVNRANERAKAGDFDSALADFDAAIEFDPQPHVLARRGVTRAARGDLAGAVADFTRALEKAPAGWPQRPQVEEMLLRARSEMRR